MVKSLIAVGLASGAVSTAAFGGAIRETMRMTTASLRRNYMDVVEEPVPEHLTEMLNKLGGE